MQREHHVPVFCLSKACDGLQTDPSNSSMSHFVTSGLYDLLLGTDMTSVVEIYKILVLCLSSGSILTENICHVCVMLVIAVSTAVRSDLISTCSF